MFGMVAVGTRVTVVNQPLLFRWQGNSLYVQSYPPIVPGKDDSETPPPVEFDAAVSNAIWQVAKQQGGSVDSKLTEQVVTQARGITVPVSRRGLTLESYLESARLVENVVPEGSNWDGSDEPAPGDAVKPVVDSGTRGGR